MIVEKDTELPLPNDSTYYIRYKHFEEIPIYKTRTTYKESTNEIFEGKKAFFIDKVILGPSKLDQTRTDHDAISLTLEDTGNNVKLEFDGGKQVVLGYDELEELKVVLQVLNEDEIEKHECDIINIKNKAL